MLMNSRKDFERNMFLLSEGFTRDQVKVCSSNRKLIRGIEDTRSCPNGRANLFTVEELSRSLANSLSQKIKLN